MYAAVLDDGISLPQQLVQDIPLYYNGFIPKNFDREFRGVVPIDQALSSSLNVPFVHLLISYGYEKFYYLLKKMGYKHLNHYPTHYGLSLILGTAETTLWEISSMYASIARSYQAYFDRPLNLGYSKQDYHKNNYIKPALSSPKTEVLAEQGLLSVAAIEATFSAMQQLTRPEQESGWESFLSKKQIAWKTGTSYGYKDAWAIGLNSKYVVGVWLGNADGEPRPDLVGARVAAPLMFNLFSFLDGESILNPSPMGSPERICIDSGMLAKKNCPNTSFKLLTDEFMINSKNCSYHQSVTLNVEQTYQVNSNCYDLFNAVSKTYFMLSPIQSHYYKKYHPNYEAAPPFTNRCENSASVAKIQLLYPQKKAKIRIPKGQDGNYGTVVFQAAHQTPNIKIFWHLDQSFVGVTEKNHQIAVEVNPGSHKLTLIDNLGNKLQRNFTVVD